MIDDAVHAAFDRLKTFQLSGGGFSYWPRGYYSSNYSDWVTSYVGHFLVEAKSLGYKVPQSLWDTWLRDAQGNAKRVKQSNHRYQAYRLFVLALAEEPHLGAMNLLKENHLKTLDPLSKKLLATSYHISGQKSVAKKIDAYMATEMNPYRELARTYGSRFRDQALITYLGVLMNSSVKQASHIQKLGQSFRNGSWFSTQETAMALLAFGHYLPSLDEGGDVEFELSLNGQMSNQILTRQMDRMELKNLWDSKIKVKSEKTLFVSVIREGIPKLDTLSTQSKNLLLSRNFYNENGRSLTADSLAQGKEVWVVYEVRSELNQSLKNVALSSLFPSGWEIFNPRMDKREIPEWLKKQRLSQPTYMDVRDDRVNWFFDLGYSSSAKFAIRINPTFVGEYRLPAVVAETMYSSEYFAAIAGSRAVVY
jgi:alpha-2-macroglobulin